MKKFIRFVCSCLLGLSFISSFASADVVTGQKLVIKKLKRKCGFNGFELAKRHTQKEWKQIQEDGKLGEEIKKICPKSKPLKEKYIPHIYDFLYHYASDSKNEGS